MIFKFAFRNLIRLPWRTILYISVVFFLVLAMTASVFVYHACEDAKTALDENYLFVASLVQREDETLALGEVFKCLNDTEVLGFNVSMSEAEGVIPTGKTMFQVPSVEEKGESVMVWSEDFSCELIAVENLSLVYPFFSGECTIREGTGLTTQGYMGVCEEILIPWWLADKYDISVGDTIIRRYHYNSDYSYFDTKVVGIYESSTPGAEVEAYPAYIPVSIAEVDYYRVLPRIDADIGKIAVDRADFILAGRDSFADFVKKTEENGVNFRYATLVFNNSTYDVLSSELDNIHMIAMFVCIVVLFVGLGVLIFFTIYLCNSRKQEMHLLTSLGMKGGKVRAMIALELLIMLIVAVGLGVGLGGFAADGVCYFVNTTVLERASASEMIQNLDSAMDFEITMPLEKDMKIEISARETKISQIDLDINYIPQLKEDEFGVSTRNYYMLGDYESYITYDWDSDEELPLTRIVALTDLDEIELSVPYEEIPNYDDFYVWAYVSENSPYVPENYDNRTALYLKEYMEGHFVEIRYMTQSIEEETDVGAQTVIIAGTYKDNEYCSGSDLLICMDDYHKAYAKSSITTVEEHFDRIGHVYKKEAS